MFTASGGAAESGGESAQRHQVQSSTAALGLWRMGKGMPVSYLCYFAHRLLSFRETEVQQLHELWHQTFSPNGKGLPLEFRLPKGHTWLSPFRFANFGSDEQIAWILARAVLIRVSELRTRC